MFLKEYLCKIAISVTLRERSANLKKDKYEKSRIKRWDTGIRRERERDLPDKG